MADLLDFKIIPILGRKVDVPADDMSMFRFIDEKTAYTHDAGGINFDLNRKRNANTKSFGYVQWSGAANSQATKCLGLFELYDGTNRDHIFFDNGRFFVLDANRKPYEAVLNFDAGTTEIVAGETITDGTTTKTAVVLSLTLTGGSWAGNDAAGTIKIHTITGDFGNDNTITSGGGGSATVNGALSVITFATDNIDLYSMIKVGSYLVFADRAEHTPYKWKHGDDYVTKLIDPSGGSGFTEFKFRHLLYFQRRLLGFYSDQTNGNIEIRFTGLLPALSGDVEFPAANQLFVPNDDPIVGVAKMGQDRAFVYCEDSINQIVYFPDYNLPFRTYTVAPDQGAVNSKSIITLGDRHYLFNKNYGFCEYRGGNQLLPISQDIEPDIQAINPIFYGLIVGAFIPLNREVIWTVPMVGEEFPSRLLFYNIDTGQWRWEDKIMRYMSNWKLYNDLDWNDLITILGTNATWDMAGERTWGWYVSETQSMIYANTDGYVYQHTSETLAGSALDGFIISPMLDFGNKSRRDTLEEIWVDLTETGSFSLDFYHRSGSTSGEVDKQNWTSIGSISCDDPEYPMLRYTKQDKIHQFKIQTDLGSEKFSINGVTFRYAPEGLY